MTAADLPPVNASLNGLSAVLLGFGYYFVKRDRLIAHRNCMVAAVCTSVLFLACYLTYHLTVKTITRNIALNEQLDQFAKGEMAAGGFSSLSEYFRDVLRARRKAIIDRDTALLAKAIEGAPENEAEALPEILAAQKRARAKMRKGR